MQEGARTAGVQCDQAARRQREEVRATPARSVWTEDVRRPPSMLCTPSSRPWRMMAIPARSALQVQAMLMVALLSLVALAASARVSLQGGKVSVATIDGSARLSKDFSLTQAPDVSSPVRLESDEVLRVAFQLRDPAGEKLTAGEAPHQVVVQLQDASDASLVHTSIVNVKPSSGKASWSQRMDRLPQHLLRRSSGQVKASLLLGFFSDEAPVRLPLLTLELPSSLLLTDSEAALTPRERNMAAQGFQRHMERRHTFGIPAADQMPPAVVSLVAAISTLVLPALTFLAVYTHVSPELSLKSPTSATIPFLTMLVALDALALLYWNGAGLTLFKMLPWLLLLSAITIITGRNALTELRRIRLGKKAA